MTKCAGAARHRTALGCSINVVARRPVLDGMPTRPNTMGSLKGDATRDWQQPG